VGSLIIFTFFHAENINTSRGKYSCR